MSDDCSQAVRYAERLIAKPLPKDKITAAGVRMIAEELVRADNRLRRAVDDRHHWQARAISAEQALGLYGPAGGTATPLFEPSIDLGLHPDGALEPRVAEAQRKALRGGGTATPEPTDG